MNEDQIYYQVEIACLIVILVFSTLKWLVFDDIKSNANTDKLIIISIIWLSLKFKSMILCPNKQNKKILYSYYILYVQYIM